MHKSSNKEVNNPNPSAISNNPNLSAKNLFLAIPHQKRQNVNKPQICSLYVASGGSSSSESMDTAWKKELAGLYEMNAMVGLEGKAKVDAQTQKVVKAEVLVQETKERVEIIRGQCDDLIEQQKQAMQNHKMWCQLSSEKKWDQYEELKQLVQLVRGEKGV